MPRPKRMDLPGLPMHVVQRGNNREAVFFDNSDRQAYLDWLNECASHYRVAVHTWCLMTNHVHLLVTPLERGALSNLFARLGRLYVPYINKTYGRSGALWQGRYRASLVDSDNYLFACSRYIELNPVRAALVAAPGEYQWSSYAAHAHGAPHPLHTPHAVYEALGDNAQQCQRVYREMFSESLTQESIAAIRDALNRNHVLGSKRFQCQVEKMLDRRLGTGRRGRPRKSSSTSDGLSSTSVGRKSLCMFS